MKVGRGNFLKTTPFAFLINVLISLFYAKTVLDRHEKEVILKLSFNLTELFTQVNKEKVFVACSHKFYFIFISSIFVQESLSGRIHKNLY